MLFRSKNRSCKPPVLEVSKEPKPTNSQMACRSPGIRLSTRIHSWKNQYRSRCIITSSQRRPRIRRQQRYHGPTTNSRTSHCKRTNHCPECKRSKKSNSKQSTRRPNRRTSRERRNVTKGPAELLVEWNETVDQRLRQGMCHLSTNEDTNP